jgi:hypothetical protein
MAYNGPVWMPAAMASGMIGGVGQFCLPGGTGGIAAAIDSVGVPIGQSNTAQSEVKSAVQLLSAYDPMMTQGEIEQRLEVCRQAEIIKQLTNHLTAAHEALSGYQGESPVALPTPESKPFPARALRYRTQDIGLLTKPGA